jgi:hypothetical protein
MNRKNYVNDDEWNVKDEIYNKWNFGKFGKIIYVLFLSKFVASATFINFLKVPSFHSVSFKTFQFSQR